MPRILIVADVPEYVLDEDFFLARLDAKPDRSYSMKVYFPEGPSKRTWRETHPTQTIYEMILKEAARRSTPWAASALLRSIGINQNSGASTVSRMLKKGLIENVTPEKSRHRRFLITDKGRAYLDYVVTERAVDQGG